MATIELDLVNGLTRAKYKKGADLAWEQLASNHPRPTRGSVANTAIDKKSLAFRRNVTIALWLLVAIAGGLSAVKQFISSESVLAPLFPPNSIFLYGAIGACWMLGEIGAILFSVAAGVMARNRLTGFVFRTASLACAALAIIGNVSAAQLHTDGVPVTYTAYLWFLTILPPVLVLACALVLEHFQREDREKSANNEALYETALTRYNDWKMTARRSSEYRAYLNDEIVIALRNLSAHNSEEIEALDRQWGDAGLDALVMREIRKWDRAILEADTDRPSQPSAPLLGSAVERHTGLLGIAERATSEKPE